MPSAEEGGGGAVHGGGVFHVLMSWGIVFQKPNYGKLAGGVEVG